MADMWKNQRAFFLVRETENSKYPLLQQDVPCDADPVGLWLHALVPSWFCTLSDLSQASFYTPINPGRQSENGAFRILVLPSAGADVLRDRNS